jgi:hypothetical protein
MPGKRLTGAQKRCPQVHRRDTSRVPGTCGLCGQHGSRLPDDLTSRTVAFLHGRKRKSSKELVISGPRSRCEGFRSDGEEPSHELLYATSFA